MFSEEEKQRYNAAIHDHKAGNLEAARSQYLHIIQAHPDFAPAYTNLGHIAHEQTLFNLAIHWFLQAHQLNPADEIPLVNLARTYTRIHALEPACACFKKLVKRHPSPHYLYDYAHSLRMNCQYDQAHAILKELLKKEPDHAQARIDAGHCCLHLGDYTAGWDYLKAWYDISPLSLLFYEKPLWDGSPLTGQTLLVHAEHRPGDIIFFARYIALLRTCQPHPVILRVPPELVPLCRGLKSDFLLISNCDTLPSYDTHCAFADLPGIFQTQPDTIPHQTPYFFLEKKPDTPEHIGLFWRGKGDNRDLADRSCPLDTLLPHLSAFRPGTFVSLQLDHTREESEMLKSLGISTPLKGATDYGHTATLMNALKAVVSIDTSVANLAGALGLPLYVLVKYSPDWRWTSGHTPHASDWFPSATIYRQHLPGDWQDPLTRLFSDLRTAE